MKYFKWFQEARFGMFIHWGVYATPGRGEWLKSFGKMTDQEYEPYVKYFEPDLFQPEKWARLAKQTGMKYFVFTAKHHDGFCLWDTKYTPYNSINAPLCRRDLLREVIDAFRKEGLKVGIYYSLPDWHHPNYIIDARHPQIGQSEERDTTLYTQFLHNQIRELLTNYGKVDIIWFDGSYPETEYIWDSEKLAELIHQCQNDILINRLPGYSDLESPEQSIPQKVMKKKDGQNAVWEGCQVFNGHWGYSRDEQTWKSPHEVVEMLIRHTSRGGNLLLNVGPTARGEIDRHSCELLAKVGEWMTQHSKSIYGCMAAPEEEFPEPQDCRYTWNGKNKRLYLHFFSWPDRRIQLLGMTGKIKFARFLHNGCEVKFNSYSNRNTHGITGEENNVTLSLPVVRPDVVVPVIELFL